MFPYVRRDGNGARTRQAASARCLARTDIRKHSFAVRVVEGWNRLPDKVKLTASKDGFKRRKMMDQGESKEQNS
jgi:hypothetical protein